MYVLLVQCTTIWTNGLVPQIIVLIHFKFGVKDFWFTQSYIVQATRTIVHVNSIIYITLVLSTCHMYSMDSRFVYLKFHFFECRGTDANWCTFMGTAIKRQLPRRFQKIRPFGSFHGGWQNCDRIRVETLQSPNIILNKSQFLEILIWRDTEVLCSRRNEFP